MLSQIIEHEENARQTLMEKKPKVVFNHIGRAYGILANAHIISSKETMNQLSFLRLGVDLELFPGTQRSLVDELFLITQPAHLQKQISDKLSAEERDLMRADMVRERLKNVSRPVVKQAKGAKKKKKKILPGRPTENGRGPAARIFSCWNWTKPPIHSRIVQL